MAGWTFYPPHTAPRALDIVWCRFPFAEDPRTPGPKPRPGLIRKVMRRGPEVYIQVAYGTSNPQRYSNRDLFIASVADLLRFGLPHATIFQLGRLAILPWAEEWCGRRRDGSGPVIGRLDEPYVSYLRHLTRR